MVYYAIRCDHCGARKRQLTGAIRGLLLPGWQCEGCGCIWSLWMVLQVQGEHCPVHARRDAAAANRSDLGD